MDLLVRLASVVPVARVVVLDLVDPVESLVPVDPLVKLVRLELVENRASEARPERPDVTERPESEARLVSTLEITCTSFKGETQRQCKFIYYVEYPFL